MMKIVWLSILLSWTLLVAQAQGNPSITLERVQEAVAATEKLARAEVENGAVPGLAVAVVFQDKLVYAEGFGVRDIRTDEPMDADTVFQLASISKSVGSTVVAGLVGDGVVSWDSRLSDFDAEFAMYDPWVTREVTIRDMYSHRSGLPEHAGDLLEDLGFTRRQVLHRLRYQPPVSSFRSAYAYTNFGVTAAAVAAASVTGETWAELSEARLYRPLGMDSTSSRFADFMTRPNKALGHVLEGGSWVHERQRGPDAQAPAGGVSSSVTDMAKWMRLQLSGGTFESERIVAEAALAETHKPHMLTGYSPFDGLPGFYGLGWNVRYDARGRLRLGHSGAFAMGAGTNVSLVPTEQLGIVVLSNGSPTGVPEGIAATFIDLVLYGKPTQNWLSAYKDVIAQMAQAQDLTPEYANKPTPSTPALPDEAYLGTYSNTFFGNIKIVKREEGLAVVQGPKDMTFAMMHFERDTFTYVTEGESAVGTAGIFFHIGADGKATEVTIENLDIDGQGKFTRVGE
jgi:CubicO group peptidase (beta-lactamase class C family)